MKLNKIKKSIETTLSSRLIQKNSFFVLEIKNNNKQLLTEEIGLIYTKTFVKTTAKNLVLSENLNPSVLKFPLNFKVFKDLNSISAYLLKNSKKSSIVFIKLGNISLKENDISLIYSTDTVYSFNSLASLLNPIVGIFNLFKN